MSPAAPSSPSVLCRPLAVLTTALIALGLAAPSASAVPGVYKGTGTDAAGDARSDLDILGADVAYGRRTGLLRATIRMGSKPPGDVDVLVGTRQASGACGLPFVTLSANVAKGTGEWRGSGGRAQARAKVSFANGTITVSVTDARLKGRTPSCAIGMVYGAGAARALRDTLPVFDVSERVAEPTVPGEGGLEGEEGTGEPPVGVDTDGDGVPDDFDGDGIADDLGGEGTGEGSGEDPAGQGAPELSLRVYGIPRRLRRGRSYEARIRIRNAGDVDATKLRVRLTRRAGVSLSRRVASVSRVRSGKGITVHVRVRLTSGRATRTIGVSVTGSDARAETTFTLRRRGAR